MARIPGAQPSQGSLIRRWFVGVVYFLTQRRLGRVIMPIQVTAHHGKIFWGYIQMEQWRGSKELDKKTNRTRIDDGVFADGQPSGRS
jgi:hypothetical protein